ncbi:MAG TPA: SCP2 sterol-binding domain-containing protein [Anaerolineales bacterium]|nr:SCP2 sterol-binding domain-containing protein [Anaerolineales bacterium]
MPDFPSQEWVDTLIEILNGDARYAEVARKWEGDLLFVIRPDGPDPDGKVPGPSHLYLDLWHGKCRSGSYYPSGSGDVPRASFVLSAVFLHLVQILKGELDPMQAMLTRKLQVTGNMAYILRNVPVVLDFVRCCRLAGVPKA